MSDVPTEVTVVFPFSATESNQLSLTPGEQLQVIRSACKGWWIGSKADGSIGLFPSAYCKAVEREQEFAVPIEQKAAQLAAARGEASPLFTGSLASSVNTNMLSPTDSQRRDALNRMQAQSNAMRNQLGIDAEESDDFGPRRTSAKTDKLIDGVIGLRKLRAAVEDDLNNINSQKRRMAAALEARALEMRSLTEQRQRIVSEVQQMDVELERINSELEVLQAAFMGDPLPEFKPPVQQAEVAEEEEEESEEEPEPVPTSSGAIKSPDEIDDPKLKKTATKLLKRIAEAKEVQESYEKRLRKLEKKKGKYNAAIEEETARLRTLEAQRTAAASEADGAAKAEEEAAKAKLDNAMAVLEAAEVRLAEAEKAKAKAAKKIRKGDQAREALEAQLQAAKESKQTAASRRAEIEQRVKTLRREVADAEAAAKAAQALVAEAEAEEAAKNTDLAQRIAKERERISTYREQIAAFKAQEAAA